MATKRQPPVCGATMHLYVRGTRKLPIVTDEEDRWMILDSIYRANRRGAKHIKRGALFLPGRGPMENSMVDIFSFCVLENHFHLQIRVKNPADASKFMQRLCTGITMNWQKKTGSSGRLFEATYRRKIIKNTYQSRVLFAYINTKNAAEAAGADVGAASPRELIEAAVSYKFSSLPDYYLGRNLPIVEKSIFLEHFPNLAALEDFVTTRPRRGARKQAWDSVPLKI